MTSMERAPHPLVSRLIELLGEDGVASDDASRGDAAWDALAGQRGFEMEAPAQPLAVALPRSREDVAAIVRLANDAGAPVVPYGGGSGLMGGARSRVPDIVIDMKRMARVREVDAVSRIAWVEAGAVLKDVDEALRPHGLMIGHDPWTYGIATIGGTISTNGLGFLGGKYGSMGDQVLGVEAVLADGSFLETRPVRPRSTGIDLARLFVAAEGEFGIVTAAALRVFPIPEARMRFGYTFETFEQGFEALLAMHALGIAPALLDYGERPAARERDTDPPTLYLGFDGVREEVDALVRRTAAICDERGGKPIDSAAVEDFWQSRHTIAENFARNRAARRATTGERGCFDYIHVSLPPSKVLEYRARTLAIAARHDVQVLEAGLWVSPGLFSLAIANTASTHAEAVQRMSATVDECLRVALTLGGSMEYCHGVGVRLAHLMREEHGNGLDVMRALKRALDPAGVLNPGKLSLTEPDSSA